MTNLPTISRYVPRPATRWGRRLGMAVIVGVAAGLAACGMEWCIKNGSEHLIGRFTHFGTSDVIHFEWMVLLLPAIGGLISGAMVNWFSPGSTTHGVEILTRAFHRNLGQMELKGPLTKTGGAALVISCGGSAGPEGPIAALGAAIGSVAGRILDITARERRILLVAGCAAGIGAIFRCPLGGALFATSILYSEPEFESDSIVSSFVASAVGYAMYVRIMGFEGPLLEGVSSLQFESITDLPWYVVLGLFCGITSIFFYYCLRTVERGLATRTQLPRWSVPALGGLATGAIACVVPQVMDNRYLFIQHAIDGGIFQATDQAAGSTGLVAVLAMVIVAKCMATGCTVGSGAPGGVLGPSVLIAGAIGAFLGVAGQSLFPNTIPDELRQALIPVGMAGVLAATMRIPLAAIVMTMEMTGSFGLLAPLMLVCAISYIVGRRWGLNEEQVGTAADSPVHTLDPILHLLESWRVGDVMETAWPLTVGPSAGMDEIIERCEPGERPVVAVAEEGCLLGIISPADMGRVIVGESDARLLVASDIMTTKLKSVDPEHDVYSALEVFARTNHEVLPVIDSGPDSEWRGMFVPRRVVGALSQRLSELQVNALKEHASLGALQSDIQLDQLLTGASIKRVDLQKLFVPIDAIGKSLRESEFSRRYNAQVVAVEQRDGSIQCPPDLDAPLKTEQRLIAVLTIHQDER